MLFVLHITSSMTFPNPLAEAPPHALVDRDPVRHRPSLPSRSGVQPGSRATQEEAARSERRRYAAAVPRRTTQDVPFAAWVHHSARGRGAEGAQADQHQL